MLGMHRGRRAFGWCLVAALILAPPITAHAQQAPDAEQNSPEWSEESLAPGEPAVETDGSEVQEAESPEAGGGEQAPLDADQALDPAALPAEADSANEAAIDHPADTGVADVVAGEHMLYLPQLQTEGTPPEDVGAQDEATIAEAGASAAAPSSRTASGDFDGNGVRDLAIGVPYEGIVAGGSNRANAGAVHVFYGNSEGGLTTRVQDFWHQDSAGVPGGVEAGDLFGYAIVAGNFDGDAYDDLAIGIPLEDDAAANEGYITVLYGSASGLSTAGGVFFTGQLGGEKEASDQFGFSLAAGNFNGDARDDLAVGIPFEDVSGQSNAGSVQVFYGNAAGVNGGLTTAGSQIWRQGTNGILDGVAAGDEFGYTLTAARFNDGVHVDLAVGVPFEDVGAIVNAGAVNVIYGSAGGLTGVNDQFWHQDSAGVDGASEASDEFGFALAAGDFDNDNRADLAIGVPFEDFVGGLTNDGVIHILDGAAAGLVATNPHELWSQNHAGVLDVSETGDEFGYSLAAGNFNGDSRTDLAIGVPFEDIGAIANGGLVHVIYGINADGLGTSSNSTWYQSKYGILETSEAGDLFGYSLGTGDYDGNFAWDLSVGVPLEDISSISNAGVANVVYGVPGVGITTVGDQLWHQNICDAFGCVFDVAQSNDRFGNSQ